VFGKGKGLVKGGLDEEGVVRFAEVLKEAEEGKGQR